MATGLNLEVIAEGIETTTQLSLLRQNDCLVGQGFLMAKPMPPEEIEKILIEDRNLLKAANAV